MGKVWGRGGGFHSSYAAQDSVVGGWAVRGNSGEGLGTAISI